jgi:hypothetical protein
MMQLRMRKCARAIKQWPMWHEGLRAKGIVGDLPGVEEPVPPSIYERAARVTLD